MKKILSTALIFVFLFNVIGYYAIYMAVLRNAHAALEQQIENDDYQKDQTLTLRLPITLPYPIHQDGFVRAQGDFEYNGEFYKLAKQKYVNDTLLIICIKNTGQKKALKIFSDLVKLSTDQPNQRNQSTKTVVHFIKDFNSLTGKIEYTDRIGIDLNLGFAFLNQRVPRWYKIVISPPPEFC